jgi:hypothetical protein
MAKTTVKTTPREDRLISRRARQLPLSTAGALRGNLAFGGHRITWGGLFAHEDGPTGLMKVVFCYALPTVMQGHQSYNDGMVNPEAV